MVFLDYVLSVIFLLPYIVFLGSFVIAIVYFPFFLYKLWKSNKELENIDD
jgi:hypothetical protein